MFHSQACLWAFPFSTSCMREVSQEKWSHGFSNKWLSAGKFKLRAQWWFKAIGREDIFSNLTWLGGPWGPVKELLALQPLRQICLEHDLAHCCTLSPCLLISPRSSEGVACYSFSTGWPALTYTTQDADMPPQMAIPFHETVAHTETL